MSKPAEPRVHVDAPAAFRPATFTPPSIAANAGARLVQWSPASDGSAVLVTGCVASPIPGWVEDMRPAVEARTVALAGKAAMAITNRPMDARSSGAGFDLRAASDLDGPVLGTARTFLGFDDSSVFTCFAVCATEGRPDARDACAAAVSAARLVATRPPPAPGIGLRLVTWGVHHPRAAASAAATIAVLLAFLAVVLRQRPRFSA